MYKLILLICATLVEMDFVATAQYKLDSRTIELGGLRQAKVVLTISESEYVMKVRMMPVRTFDVATNARLNRAKGRELALLALAKLLSGEKSVEFTVSGAQIEQAGTSGDFYTLNLKVPRKGVSLARKGEKPSATTKQDRIAFSSALFTRKREYLEILSKVTTSALADLQVTENKAKEIKDNADSFFLTIGQIEKKLAKNLHSLGQEIKADLLLLSIEQEELCDVLTRQKNQVLSHLKEAVKKYKLNQAKEKFP
jgi:hypothetical protein